MRNHLIVTVIAALIALSNAAVKDAEPLAELASTAGEKVPSNAKDLEGAASDRTFLIGREYGYGSGGYGGGYGNYPITSGNSLYNPIGSGYYNRVNGANSVYRGYQSGSGYGGILGGGHTGWGYYGNGGYGGLGGLGYGGYEDGYSGLGGRGYNRWNSLDGYGGYAGTGYGGVSGSGYGGYGASGYGASAYPYGSRGNSYGSYSGYTGYPSGYRGYS